MTFAAFAGESDFDDSANAVITGCDMDGNKVGTPAPESFVRLLNLAPATIGCDSCVRTRYHQNKEVPERIDNSEVVYYAGHGSYNYFRGARYEKVCLEKVHLGDHRLRFLFMDSCNVLAHGPVDEDMGSQPWCKPENPEDEKQNVFLRWLGKWQPPFGPDLELVCAGSTRLREAPNELLRNIFNERLSMAEAFLMSHATADQIPLCLGRRKAFPKSIRDVVAKDAAEPPEIEDENRFEAIFARQITEDTSDVPRSWGDCSAPLPELPIFLVRSYRVPWSFVPEGGGWRRFSGELGVIRMHRRSGAVRLDLELEDSGWKQAGEGFWRELLEDQVDDWWLHQLLFQRKLPVVSNGSVLMAQMRSGERLREVSLEAVWPEEDYGRTGGWNHEPRVTYLLLRKHIELRNPFGRLIAEVPVLGDGGEDWVRVVGDGGQISVRLIRRRLIGAIASLAIPSEEAVALAREQHGLPDNKLLGCRRGYLEAPAHCRQTQLSLYYELAFERPAGMQPVVHRVRAHRRGVDVFTCDEFPSSEEIEKWDLPFQSRYSLVHQ